MFDYDEDDDFVAFQPMRTSSYSKYATRSNPYLSSSATSSHRLRPSSVKIASPSPSIKPIIPPAPSPAGSSTLTYLFIFALLPLIPIVIWLLLSSYISPTPPVPQTLRNRRIILLIAHPDDEAMFFSPTLLHLTSPELGNHLKILCMSTGNADGLGETRTKELEKSALTLGVRRREDVFVMDDTRFQDGADNTWSPDEIAKVLAQAFAPPPSPPPPPAQPPTTYLSKSGKRKPLPPDSRSQTNTPPPPQSRPDGPRATIDVLITFDSQGISSHPNHIALHAGARTFLANIMRGHTGRRCPVTLYTLPTVNVVQKYSFFLGDAVLGLVNRIVGGGGGGGGEATKETGTEGKREQEEQEERKADTVLFVNDLSQYRRARDAMVNGHVSQMLWFRWGWISLGRYMVVNDLKRETVPDDSSSSSFATG